jgi:hypothetical protein
MKRLLTAVLFAFALPACAAVDVAGVPFDDTTKLGDSTLQLNGTGIRTRMFFKVYAIGLYLPEKQSDAGAVLAMPGPKRIHMVMLRELGAEKLADALVEGIRKNHGESELGPLNARIEELRTAMLALKEVPKGAVILLDFTPAGGTHISFGGKTHSRDIPGEDFYRALLKIWLGGNPAAADLKEALLGRSR